MLGTWHPYLILPRSHQAALSPLSKLEHLALSWSAWAPRVPEPLLPETGDKWALRVHVVGVGKGGQDGFCVPEGVGGLESTWHLFGGGLGQGV